MKNIFLIFFLAIFTCFFSISCKKYENIAITTKAKDTLFLKENTILFITPSEKKTEELKKQHGEDFYTIADDANYYYSNATEYLDSLKIKYANYNKNEVIAFKEGLKTKIITPQKSSWYSILYKDKKAKVVDLINFKKEYNIFYKSSIEENKSLKMWYGTYLNSDSESLDSYETIIHKIGWYKLSIKTDEITFESDRRMESEFPTESPGGLYINYVCNYKIEGDTIKLFEKKDSTHKKPFEIENTTVKPVLLLFKKNNKFYGISEDITESENLNNAVRGKGKSPYLFKKFDK
ncbi:hypothetical protein [Chryseobacterium sp. AG844]|uniref:hypothetical protein n=1 Tax=Chryseobacterium sp. AG844 TaxID=2183998 RepID=UPI000D713E5E|nr:hypothetical protein [Chryseobacterium sp. AG844]PWW30740.1 hypothetical protein DEU40_101156 [Chryseobacterium sp. AG844]